MSNLDTPARRYGPLSALLSSVQILPQKPDISTVDFYPHDPSTDAFCHRWTPQHIAGQFDDIDLLSRWHEQGFEKIWIEIPERTFPKRHELEVWTEVGDASELLLQIVVWLDYIYFETPQIALPAFSVEHLRLQNPGKSFSEMRLPGQDYPSSGLLRRIFGLIKLWAADVGAQIIAEVPEFFHTATIFSEYFFFADPEMEAMFQAMKRDLMSPDTSLAEVSFAFENGQIFFQNEPYLWPTELQVYPLSHDLKKHLKPSSKPLPDNVFEKRNSV